MDSWSLEILKSCLVLGDGLQVPVPEQVVRQDSLKGPLQPQPFCDFVNMCTLFSCFIFSDIEVFTEKHNEVQVALGIFSLKYENERRVRGNSQISWSQRQSPLCCDREISLVGYSMVLIMPRSGFKLHAGYGHPATGRAANDLWRTLPSCITEDSQKLLVSKCVSNTGKVLSDSIKRLQKNHAQIKQVKSLGLSAVYSSLVFAVFSLCIMGVL